MATVAGSVIRRVFVAPLLLLNFVLFLSVAAIAGWAINLAIDYGWQAVSYNPATFYVVLYSLIAGVVGLASVLIGAQFVSSAAINGHSAAAASGTIAWILTLLAAGLVAKEISINGIIPLYWQITALEALVIIATITQLLYLIGVGAVGHQGSYFWRARGEPTTESGAAPANSTPIIVKD